MKKLTPLVLIICFGLFFWSVYSSFALSSAQSQIHQQKKTINQLQTQKKNVPNRAETPAKARIPVEKKAQTTDSMKAQLTKDADLTNKFFNSLFTYNESNFNQRYQKAARYCQPSVLDHLIGAGSGHDTEKTVNPKKGQPPTLVDKSGKSKEKMKMQVKEVDYFYNTSKMNYSTGVVKVVYEIWTNGTYEGATTSWYHISIDRDAHKISQLSLFELGEE